MNIRILAKKLWNDPVGSKVIASAIYGLLVVICWQCLPGNILDFFTHNIFPAKYAIVILFLMVSGFLIISLFRKNRKKRTEKIRDDFSDFPESEKIGNLPIFILHRQLIDYRVEVPEHLNAGETTNSLLYFFKKYYTNFQIGIPSSPTTKLDSLLRLLVVPALKTYGLLEEIPYSKSGVFPHLGSAKLNADGIKLRGIIFTRENTVVQFSDN